MFISIQCSFSLIQSSFFPYAGLTKREAMGNTILFLSAGFQTTADTMATVFYELAMNPEVQTKVSIFLL